MLKLYRTDNKVLHELDRIKDGCWVNMVDPSYNEVAEIAGHFNIVRRQGRVVRLPSLDVHGTSVFDAPREDRLPATGG